MESPFRSEEVPVISSLESELNVQEDELFNILSNFSRNEESTSGKSETDADSYLARSSGNEFTSSDVLLSGTSQSSCDSNTPSPRNEYETATGSRRAAHSSSITLFSSHGQISPVTFNASSHHPSLQGGSPNSNHSAMSLDSAIGDVYSVQTPSRSSIDGDSDKVDLSSVLVTSAPRSSHGRVISPIQNQRVARRRRSRQSSPFGYPRHSGPPVTYMPHIFPSPQLNATVQDLCHKYHMAFYTRPRPRPKNLGDPLYVTNRLVNDAMVRFQRFFASLNAVQTLPISDMNVLYNANICVVAIIRACAMSTNLSTLLDAFPFPYGQNLQAEEALFLIFSNNLYTELKALVTKVQSSALLKDVQVMIFCMILAFFNAVPDILAHHQVYDSQHFYKQKLMVSELDWLTWGRRNFGAGAMVCKVCFSLQIIIKISRNLWKAWYYSTWR